MLVRGLLALVAAGGLFMAGRLTAPSGGGKPAQHAAPSAPSGQVGMGREAQRNIGLRLARAQTGPVRRHLHAAAMVAADETREAFLRPAGQGRVVAVSVQAGDGIRRGQVLLTYADLTLDALDAQRTTARAQLAQAKAARQAAQASLQRGLELRGGAIAASEIDHRRTLLAQADAALAADRGRLADVEQQIGEHGELPEQPGIAAIRAPADGTLMSIEASPGMLVDPSRILAATLDLSNVRILSSVYQNDVRLVKPGGTAVITVSGLPGRRIEARIRSIGQSLDPRSDAVLVRSDVPNPDGALRPGMIADAELETVQEKTALTIPEAAIQQVDGKPVVFVRTGDETFQRHAVELGLQTDEVAEVKSGLSAGDMVATSGSFALKSRLLQSQIAAGG